MGDFPNANDVTEADQSEGGYAHRHSLLVGSLIALMPLKASERQTSLLLAAQASIKRKEMVGIEKNFEANDGAFYIIDFHSYKFPSSKSMKQIPPTTDNKNPSTAMTTKINNTLGGKRKPSKTSQLILTERQA